MNGKNLINIEKIMKKLLKHDAKHVKKKIIKKEEKIQKFTIINKQEEIMKKNFYIIKQIKMPNYQEI